MNAIEVLFLLPHGKKQKRHFKTEDEAVDYLTCAMVEQGDCMAEYEAKEKSRRDKTKKSIKLD